MEQKVYFTRVIEGMVVTDERDRTGEINTRTVVTDDKGETDGMAVTGITNGTAVTDWMHGRI